VGIRVQMQDAENPKFRNLTKFEDPETKFLNYDQLSDDEIDDQWSSYQDHIAAEVKKIKSDHPVVGKLYSPKKNRLRRFSDEPITHGEQQQ
jgi:hypothetical protein